MKEIVRVIQLVLSAAEAERDNRIIDETRIPEIEAARKRLALMRAGEVIEGLAALRRSGLPLTLDLAPKFRSIAEEPPARPAGRMGFRF
ncbi:MAG: hypothetical protein HZT41_10570 [Dechloromonas sp.]|nr:MAG: hypothetical protein HZT41_10570 [Dechloromonas sp.]